MKSGAEPSGRIVFGILFALNKRSVLRKYLVINVANSFSNNQV